MMWTQQYKNNRPLLNSIVMGLFYLFFCWSLEFGDGTKGVFITLMFFLPGVTFPLTTCYYKTPKSTVSEVQIIIHMVLSVIIYHGSVWLFSGEGLMKYMSVLAGFLGSLLFLLVTKFLLKRNISTFQILITSIASGLAFFQYELNGQHGIFMGIAVFFWTTINGLTLNIEYRKAINQ